MDTRIKKLFMLLVTFLATTAFASCGDDEGGGTTVNGLKLSATSLTFNKGGGLQELSVQAPSQVSATTDASWLTVTAGTMSANLKVTPLTVTAAAMSTETTDRTATIIVKAGSETATVNVTQKAGDVLIVSKTEYDVAAEGGIVDVQVTTNGHVTVSIDKSWLTQQQGIDSYVFTATANTAGARTATITFSLNKEVATVTVRQAAGQPATITAKAMDIAKQMYPGWNLGNTMEGGNNANNWTNNGGVAAETSWQSTKTTQSVIDFVKTQGFKSVRIPTAWVMGHITDANNVTIDVAWLNRVKEIVDYCISDGLYVLLNDHWDGGWLENSFSDISNATVTANSDKLKKLWTQIAEAFRDYDEHLLFAGLNEPDCDSQAKTDALLKYEQAFIEAVRATGGNNALRTLVVQGPSTDIEKTNNWLDVSKLNDPAGLGRLMVEVHYYTPPQFTGVWENNQPIWFWGAANHVNGDTHNATWGEESTVQSQFRMMKTKYADKGYPVILGEYGANWRKLSSNQDEHDASIKLYNKVVCQTAIQCGMVPFVWDINVANQNGTSGIMTVINRVNTTVFCQPAMEGITEGVASASWQN